jgi:predicted MFS family arabinose efflux permease
MMLQLRFAPQNTGQSMLDSMKQGFGFIRKQGAMEALIVLAFCMTGLAIPMITFLPVFAKDIFRGGPTTFTILLVCSGLGSVAGALTVAALGNVRNKGRVALLMLIAMGATMGGFALSKNLVLSSIFLFCAGAALMGAFTMISSLVQLITANEMRGRVMSVYNVAFRGGMPFGNLASGWLIPMFSAPVVISANGLLLILVGTYFLTAQRRVHRCNDVDTFSVERGFGRRPGKPGEAARSGGPAGTRALGGGAFRSSRKSFGRCRCAIPPGSGFVVSGGDCARTSR